MSWAFEAIDVHHHVGDHLALAGVNFAAPQGAVTAVVGPAEAGKTALVRLLCGLERPSVGAVLVGGSDISRARSGALRRLRRKTGVAFQAGHNHGFGLFGEASAHQNLVLSMQANGRVPGRRIDVVAGEYLEAVGLGGRAAITPAELNRDECKRLALVRALCLRAPLAVLDDVDGDLDPHHVEAISALVRSERDRRAASYLVTTRSAHVAAQMADHTVTLEQGRVVEEAAVANR